MEGRKIESIVRIVLTGNKECRNSDKKLLLEVWELEGLKLTDEQKRIFLEHCSIAESITRARRKLRPEYPGTDEVEQARFELFEQYREEYGYGNLWQRR
jgi:hypothetical protein